MISVFPYLVPPSLTIWDTAAAPASQRFMLVGTLGLLPIILGYFVFVFWIFRGKVRHGEGYHHSRMARLACPGWKCPGHEPRGPLVFDFAKSASDPKRTLSAALTISLVTHLRQGQDRNAGRKWGIFRSVSPA